MLVNDTAGGFTHLYARTHSTRVLAGMGSGGAAAGFRLDFKEKLFARNYKIPVIYAASCSLEWKLKVAERAGRFEGLGVDLVAETLNGLMAPGGEPLFFEARIGAPASHAGVAGGIFREISDGCVAASCAFFPGVVEENAPRWSMIGFAVGAVEKTRLLGAREVEADDSLIGVASNGLDASSFRLIDRLIGPSGDALQTHVAEFHGTLAEELLRPARAYAGPLLKLFGKYKVKRTIKAMAEVSEGGLEGALKGLLPEGLSARVKRTAWRAPPVFEWLREKGGFSAAEMAANFNMGIGFVLVVRPAFTRAIAAHLRTLGERAYFLGKVKKSGADDAPSGVKWT